MNSSKQRFVLVGLLFLLASGETRSAEAQINTDQQPIPCGTLELVPCCFVGTRNLRAINADFKNQFDNNLLEQFDPDKKEKYAKVIIALNNSTDQIYDSCLPLSLVSSKVEGDTILLSLFNQVYQLTCSKQTIPWITGSINKGMQFTDHQIRINGVSFVDCVGIASGVSVNLEQYATKEPLEDESDSDDEKE